MDANNLSHAERSHLEFLQVIKDSRVDAQTIRKPREQKLIPGLAGRTALQVQARSADGRFPINKFYR